MARNIKELVKGAPFYPHLRAVKDRFTGGDGNDSLIYIHIGKCGGMSLWDAINQSAVVRSQFSSISRVHIVKPPALRKAKYLVVIRNPVDRALSAFNWRYKLVVKDAAQRGRFEGEYEVLSRYGTLNSLAESLYSGGTLNPDVASDFCTIHHLKENISFYLSELLEEISPEQIYAVLVTEFLDEDIRRYLSVEPEVRRNENKTLTNEERLCLSYSGRSNLRMLLAKDYAAVEKLADWADISPERREILLR